MTYTIETQKIIMDYFLKLYATNWKIYKKWKIFWTHDLAKWN
jgi:hypothetical protein